METLYCHSAQVKGKPRVTVAGIVENGILRIGFSRCSHKDVYVKKLGNVIAEGRARSKKAHMFEITRTGDLIPEFIKISLTIIGQEGGVAKTRKEKQVVTSTLPEEIVALQKHN